MTRKRNWLISIGEAFSGTGGPVKELHEASPQARHHFTQADQVHQLVEAREADADLGFMARLMALCSLPRSNPGNQHQYKRVNGPYKLILSRTGEYKLPFGNLPRLLMAWLSTEAVRTQSRELVLGRSLSEFIRSCIRWIDRVDNKNRQAEFFEFDESLRILGLDRDAVREAADRAKRKGRGPGATRQGGLIHEKPVLH